MKPCARARQKVELPAAMRDHLRALREIQAADIAEQRIGMSSLEAHGAAHMAPYMPKPMQDIGTAMHRAASRFARTAQEAAVKGDMAFVFDGFSKLLQQCVACHEACRVKEPLINSVRPELVEGRAAQDIDSSDPPFMVRQAHHERRELIGVSLSSYVLQRWKRDA